MMKKKRQFAGSSPLLLSDAIATKLGMDLGTLLKNILIYKSLISPAAASNRERTLREDLKELLIASSQRRGLTLNFSKLEV